VKPRLGQVVVLVALIAAHVQAQGNLITSSTPGEVLRVARSTCEVETQAQAGKGIRPPFCSTEQYLVLSEADYCGLTLGLNRASKDDLNAFIANCLPNLLFGGARVSVTDPTVKRELLHSIGRNYDADNEAVAFTYTVDLCKGETDFVSGMAYIGDRKGLAYVSLSFPRECLAGAIPKDPN